MKNTDCNLKTFDLEAFMKSITYPPKGMTTNLARKQMKNSGSTDTLVSSEQEMLILRRALEILPIGINDDDLLAGNYGVQFSENDLLEQILQADSDEYSESAEYKVWNEEERIISGTYMLFGIYTPSHTCVDYETILTRGLEYYEGRIKERLEKDIDEYGRKYLYAMLESINTVGIFTRRYVQLAEWKLKNCNFDKRKKELMRIIDALKKVPYKPADTFFEALQSMWIIHTVTPASERSWASVSLGRTDKYLYPYFERWLNGGNTEKEAIELLKAFFKMLDSYGDGSCAMNIGPDWNQFSELLIKVEKQIKLRSPIIAARMKKTTANSVYDTFIGQDLFGIGQPTFYNEEACLHAMAYRGMSENDDYSVNSCMGNVIVGKELADMWGCCVNMNLPLELAVNRGIPLRGKLPESCRKFINSVKPRDPDSIRVIKDLYAEYIKGITEYVAHQNLLKASWVALNRPNPFLSIFLDGCIEFGRDRAHSAVHMLGKNAEDLNPNKMYDFEMIKMGRGTKYHNVTVLSMGFANAADSISAIDELVFKKGKYTLEEIKTAAAENYCKTDKDAEIYAELQKCPKYADGSDAADENAAFVLNALADASELCYNGNVRFLPTCHTIDANVQFGNCVYASLDSRRDGEPFGKNAGPVIRVIKTAPTDLIIAASKLPQFRFSGGVPIDIYAAESILKNEEAKAKFRGLLKSYFKLGGMQVQVNSVNIELLRQAYDHPEEHPNVIVRKGGFSIYFTDMLKEVQRDMIERFEKEIDH